MGLWPNEHRNLTVEKSTEDKEVKLDSATAIFTTQLVKKKESLSEFSFGAPAFLLVPVFLPFPYPLCIQMFKHLNFMFHWFWSFTVSVDTSSYKNLEPFFKFIG